MQTKLKKCDGCQDMKVIWKSSGTGGKKYCAQCWSADSGKKQIPTVGHKPIPPRSTKRSKEERLYLGKRIIFLNNKPLCKVHFPCTLDKECHDSIRESVY